MVPDRAGGSSAVEAHGTLHWLRHKDGPSRVLEATPGVRARLPRPFGEGQIAYVADHDGVEALYLREIAGNPDLRKCRLGRQSGGQPAAPAQKPAKPQEESDAGTPLPRPVSAAALTRPDAVAAVPASRPTERTGHPANAATAGDPAGVTADTAVAAGQAEGNPAAQQGRSSLPTRIDFPKPTRASAIEASPDGNWLAVGTAFGDIYLADTRTGTLSLVSSIGEGSIEGFSLVPGLGLAGLVRAGHLLRFPQPAAHHPRGRRRQRGGREAHHHRGHRRTLPRRIAVVHPRRQVPRVPLQPQLRPGLRRTLLRPVLPQPDQALPRGPRRRHAVAVRPER